MVCADTFDADLECVFFIDGATGNRSVVSGNGIGTGIAFSGFGLDLVLLPGGNLVVSDLHTLIRVNPSTGDRSLLTSSGVGGGPDPGFLEFLTLTPDGQVLASAANDGVLLVDPANGNRTLITGGSFGSGPEVGLYREAVSVVPEPSCFAVLVLAGICGAFSGRIRLRTPHRDTA